MQAQTRAERNRNPGNIRKSSTIYQGETPSNDKAFKAFKSNEWGYRAMFSLLCAYQKRYGIHTIRAMISRYAPSIENNTEGYIDTVCRLSGIAPDEYIDTMKPDRMIRIVAAMSWVEGGKEPVMREIEEGWRLFDRS